MWDQSLLNQGVWGPLITREIGCGKVFDPTANSVFPSPHYHIMYKLTCIIRETSPERTIWVYNLFP